MAQLLPDLRTVLRSLSRQPGFCAVVILTLALGIGANSAIFSVVNAVLLKPLPYREPERLALLWSRWSNFDKTWLSEAEFLDYARLEAQVESAAAWSDEGDVAITGDGTPESVGAMAMSHEMLPVLGMEPAVGRGFSVEEDLPNAPPVAMIGYDLWRRRYGGDPSLVGRTITVDGTPVRVVGVLPRAFRLPLEFQVRQPAQYVLPLGMERANPQRGNHGLFGVARLRAGTSAAGLTAAMQALTRQWTEAGLYPPAMGFSAFATALPDEVSGSARLALAVLAAAVGLLLLLTAANVANLVLVRADGRARDLAVRAALGAGRRELLRLALTESLVLSLAGGMAGLVLAWAGVRLLVARAPTTIPRLSEVSVDPAVLGFTLLVSVATGLLFGLLPMRTILKAPLATTLREGSRGQSSGVTRRRHRALLVASEMALAVLLLIGAGLTVRSFLQLMAIDPGFDGSRALTLRIALPAATYADAARVAGFFEEVRTEVRRLPGVEAAGFVRVLPLADDIGDSGLRIDGRPVPAGTPGRSADWQAVTPGWFEAMRIRLVQGRFIDSTDVMDGAPVIVINETLAREYFPGEDPLGQRIGVGRQDGPLRTIVGVVGDVRHHGLTAAVKRTFYVPHAQWATSFGNPRRAMTLVARTRGDPRALLEPVAALVRQRDPDLSLSAVTTLDEVLATATREQRFTMALMSGFALLALVLAAVGVYGVIAYTVAQRSREIGIRLALGAGPARVERLLVRQGMGPVVAGLGVGLVVALGVSRFLESLLYGVGVVDPVTFVVVPVVLAAVAVVAVVVPARRAVSGDPVGVLKGD